MTKISQHVLDILEWPQICEELKSRCACSLGKSDIDNLSPLKLEESILRMSKISALKEITVLKEPINLAGVSDISDLVQRASKGSMLLLEEIALVKNFVSASERIRYFLKLYSEEYETLKEEYEKIYKLDAILKLLTESLNDKNELSHQKYPKLLKLKQESQQTRHDIEKKLSSLINSASYEKFLQEKIFTTVNQRYVLLVKSTMKGRINGTVQDISASGATLYMEPDAVKDLNNSLIMLELEYQNEIIKILKELSLQIGNLSFEILSNLETIAYIDFLNACSKFSIAINASAPQIVPERIIELKNAKHPLLYLKTPQTTVANDIELGKTFNCLIISGANTGGKTVLLKTVGLVVLFAMFGLHLPCGPDSKIGIFENILADIGDEQSLEASLSTFSGQIVIIKNMLESASDKTLVLIDEIIVGTNPRQGAALAQAILEIMVETGCLMIVTTHYTELKEMASENPKYKNASVSFDLESLTPAYRLITGIPGVSYAIEIARNYGLSEKVLKRALKLINSRDISIEALLEETQKFRQETDEEKYKISLLKTELASEKEKYISMQKELKELTAKIKKQQGIAFLEEIETYRSRIAAKITSLQNMNLKEAGETQNELLEIEETISQNLKDDAKENYAQVYYALNSDNIDNIKEGMKVFVLPLETEGILEDIDLSKKTALVLFGGTIRSRFNVDDLLGINKELAKKKIEPPKYMEPERGTISTTIQTSYNTIDLRGKRVDEGLSIMDAQLDKMSRNGIEMAVIIHGHGTGAMKHAVRDSLKISLYVSDFRRGESAEGGDGVTVARIKR
jgi:DNA mismatch repair protein MutS2